jgi:hypothetical protein
MFPNLNPKMKELLLTNNLTMDYDSNTKVLNSFINFISYSPNYNCFLKLYETYQHINIYNRELVCPCFLHKHYDDNNSIIAQQ